MHFFFSFEGKVSQLKVINMISSFLKIAIFRIAILYIYNTSKKVMPKLRIKEDESFN